MELKQFVERLQKQKEANMALYNFGGGAADEEEEIVVEENWDDFCRDFILIYHFMRGGQSNGFLLGRTPS